VAPSAGKKNKTGEKNMDTIQSLAAQVRARGKKWGHSPVGIVKNARYQDNQTIGITKKLLCAEITRQEEISGGRQARKQVKTVFGQGQRIAALNDKYKQSAFEVAPPTVQDEADYSDLRVVDSRPHIRLIRWAYWKKYSNKFGSRCFEGVGLVFFDLDSREFRPVRVGPNVTTINEALEYIQPAPVKKAAAEGKPVVRQGDVYLVPSRVSNYAALEGTNHRVESTAEGVIINHPQHAAVLLTGNWSAHLQKALPHGVFGGAGVRAD
jgi:hypothetical protein